MKIILTEQQFNSLLLNESRVKSDERDKLYMDDEWLVVAPLTHNASCKYGAFTPWCTATRSNEDGFNQRHILIYILNKKENIKFAVNFFSSSDYSWWDNINKEYVGKNPFNLPSNIIKTIFDYVNKKNDFSGIIVRHNKSQQKKNINGKDVQINQYNEYGKQGYWEVYYDNKNLWYKGNFLNGFPNGYWEEYYENGLIYSKGSYKNGEKNGYWEFYYPSGQLYRRGSYKNGKEEGIWEYYYENGQLAYERSYKNGELINISWTPELVRQEFKKGDYRSRLDLYNRNYPLYQAAWKYGMMDELSSKK